MSVPSWECLDQHTNTTADAVVWLGDFNYRIGLSSEAARGLVKKRDLSTLYENDQLNLQMVAGLAFPYYSEARITFMPTYKFDFGTDEYDSSYAAPQDHEFYLPPLTKP